MNLLVKIVATMLTLTVPVLPVSAQDAQPITLSGDVKAVKTSLDANGTEQIELVAPEVIVPGDRLIFGTDYSNGGDEIVTDFVVTNPLPAAVRLAEDADPSLTVSVDGGETWGRLADLVITNDQGVRAATPADVTHVRWSLETVEPGASGRLEYPAIIR